MLYDTFVGAGSFYVWVEDSFFFFVILVVLVETHAAHEFMWHLNENLCSKGTFLKEINFRRDYKSYKHDHEGIRI